MSIAEETQADQDINMYCRDTYIRTRSFTRPPAHILLYVALATLQGRSERTTKTVTHGDIKEHKHFIFRSFPFMHISRFRFIFNFSHCFALELHILHISLSYALSLGAPP